MGKKKLAVGVIAALAVILNILIIWTDLLPLWSKVGCCVAVILLGVICIVMVEELLRIPLEIFRDRGMFLAIVKNDFQARFAGSYLGLFWAYVQPVITLCLYWFVFQFGLRSGNVSNHPFILYLMAGLIPWFYFSESWGGASGSLVEYSFSHSSVRKKMRKPLPPLVSEIVI